MSNIGIKIATNIHREGVLIDPRRSAADKVIKDEKGKIVKVIKADNIISKGKSARLAAKEIYGKI